MSPSLVTDPGPEKRVFLFEPTLLRRIVSLGLPVVIGMLTQTLINQVDSIFIGHLPGNIAVPGTAALGFSIILFFAVGGSVTTAVAVGTQAMTARRFAEGNHHAAGQVLANSLALAVVASLVATALGVGFATTLVQFVHKDPAVREAGASFLQIRFLGIPAMVLTASCKAFYDGLSKVRVHMTVAIVMNLINLFLCYALVFGHFGFPRLEVNGAAWAAVISSACGTVMMLAWSARPADRVRFRAFRFSNIETRVMFGIARLSIFSGIAQLVVMTGFLLFYAIVGRIDEREGLPGVNASAAATIISVCMLIFMTCIAFGTSTATLVSQSLGAKKTELAARYGWQSVGLMVIVMAVVGALIALFPEPVARVFLHADRMHPELEALKEQVIALASHDLRFCAIIAPIAAGALVLTQALYGAGEPRFVMIVEFVLHFTCMVPLAYLFAIVLEQGLMGCWYATACYGAGLFAATGIKFYRGGWKKTVI